MNKLKSIVFSSLIAGSLAIPATSAFARVEWRDISNDRAQLRTAQEELARNRQQLDSVGRVIRFSGPLYLNHPLRIDHQLHDVLTTLRVNGDALAARDVADDLFAMQRITTTRACHH